MKIEQIYTGCLAHGAYYIESNGEAAIIDPLREITPYTEKAKENNAEIKYVLETHFHADFVSGHLDLAKATGAKIIYGPTASPGFNAYIAHDGEELPLGKIKLKVLHTPGHTMESTCYLLKDENGKDTALFSGDTLFIGDVGRPDLAQKAASMTKEELAGILYDSLHKKIMPLNDDIIIYPAHGAGSACGKNMSKETFDSLGHQKETNYALRARTKEQFIKEVTTGLMPPPAYFPLNAMLNKQGYQNISEVIKQGTQALRPAAFETAANETGAVLLDTRDPQLFAKGFIPNSVNIGINGSFAPWAGTLLPDIKQQILIIADEGRETEAVTRLARVGYDHSIGYLQGGFDAWKNAGKETDSIRSVTVAELAAITAQDDSVSIIDVRKKNEYDSQHITHAISLPLDFINESMASVDKNKTYYVHCAAGYRSMIFISILRARGFYNLVDVQGGFAAIKESSRFPLSKYVCPASML